MSYTLAPIRNTDRTEIVDIFNQYVENGFAAFPDQKVPYEVFDGFMKQAQGYPTLSAKDTNDALVGFALLRPYNPLPVFAHAAEVTIFIRPDHTGKGLGTDILTRLLQQAAEKKIREILAGISSLNDGSLRFYQAHGFKRCGCFEQVVEKKGRCFDVVWMQKHL